MRAIIEGIAIGDSFCTLLAEEYKDLGDNQELKNKFVDVVYGKCSQDAYKAWLMQHKNLFYDDRFYVMI